MQNQLTAICQAAVKNSPAGLSAEQIADLLGCAYPTLMSELSGQPGHKLGAWRMLEIMRITGSVAPMNFLARELGGIFVQLPHASLEGHELTRSLCESIRQYGDFVAQVSRSLEDGTITGDELSRISAEGQETLTGILRVMRLARIVRESRG